MIKDNLNKSEKVLLAINKLKEKKKEKITVEDISVMLWKMWPNEFCMIGYPKYPNNDIQKHITKPLNNNWIVGGVSDYKLTEKGHQYIDEIKNISRKSRKDMQINKKPRFVKSEFIRIINSKIFKYYLENKDMSFLESDLFDFLGTSPRSLNTKDRNIFLTRYILITKDLISFCKETKNKNKNSKKILELWNELSSKFSLLLNKKIGIKK